MHRVGKLFPRSNRSPAVVPIAEVQLTQMLGEQHNLSGWRCTETRRISSGFYKSQALRLCADGNDDEETHA